MCPVALEGRLAAPGEPLTPLPPGLCLCVLNPTVTSLADERRLVLSSVLVRVFLLRWLCPIQPLTSGHTVAATLRLLACADRAWRSYIRDVVSWINHPRTDHRRRVYRALVARECLTVFSTRFWAADGGPEPSTSWRTHRRESVANMLRKFDVGSFVGLPSAPLQLPNCSPVEWANARRDRPFPEGLPLHSSHQNLVFGEVAAVAVRGGGGAAAASGRVDFVTHIRLGTVFLG